MNVSQFEGWTAAEATTALLDKGWQKLGSGAAAYCFGKRGSGRVVKIVCGDRGQETAVDLFERHPEVSAFPRIYSYAWLADHGCFIVEMERLRPQPEPDWSRVDFEPRYSLGVRDIQDDSGGAAQLLGQDAAGLIRAAYHSTGACFDLHVDNIMLRKDGSIVAVDPFYYSNDGKVSTSVKNAIAAHREEPVNA